MKRTLFYDRETGELLHSHYEVRAVGGGDDGGARLSAPGAADLDAGLAELVSRGLDPQRLGSLTTSVAPQSSRRTERWVDVKTGRLRSRRLEPTDDLAAEGDD
jgi:hypothetical protein